ncbi:MAG TPA: hypothetical protein VMT37_07495 [Solirubrobacterales bacterium]|nr:hypothetical protein [Solirubrobacterales bacterium]
MDILRNLFGNLTSGVIRLAVTVGILAAVYFFIVKPVLKTADNAVNTTNSTLQHSLENSGLDNVSKTLEQVNHQVEVQIQRSFHVAKKQGNPKKLIHCIERAQGNVHKIQRCTVKF